MAIYKLKGTLQHYVWGGKDYIPQFLGIEKSDPYYAELWLGAHSSSPSTLEIDGSAVSLKEFLNRNPAALGAQARRISGDELPYLLKILDVKKPLSIQLHPTKIQARRGFARENAEGIGLNDAKRIYKDNNHKPEMMIALSYFWLLHGFKTKAKITETLKIRPSLSALADKLAEQDLHRFYAEIMQADQAQLADWLLPVIEQNRGKSLSPENPDYWVCYALEAMDIKPDQLDAGLICFYLFNIVQLKKGEGIFQDAGIPHAYLRGQNIELMACSDNVIRGGLTPKHVDIPELLKVVDCTQIEPQIIAPASQAKYLYPTPAKDFALENIGYETGDIFRNTAENAEILLVMQGAVKISVKSTALYLKQGESAFIAADTDYQIEGLETGYSVIAGLP